MLTFVPVAFLYFEQAEDKYVALYPYIEQKNHQSWAAMVSTVDDTVQNVTTALKAAGMWNNTVLKRC